jgi:succinate dehydrogenase/fumarate reductase flavoprotein subunit
LALKRNKRYIKKHPDIDLKSHKKYREKNREILNAKQKERHAANREVINAKARERARIKREAKILEEALETPYMPQISTQWAGNNPFLSMMQ